MNIRLTSIGNLSTKSFLYTALFLFLTLGCTDSKTAQNHLRLGNGAEPETLDPQKCGSLSCMRVIQNLFEGLSKRQGNKFVPGMAKWDIDSSGTLYTFHLFPKKWQNGQQISAKDFEYAWKRLKIPETGAPYSSLLNGVDTFEAKNDSIFEVKLKAPMAYFIELCAFVSLMPALQDQIEKHGSSWTQVGKLTGNGPYKLEKWVSNQIIQVSLDSTYEQPENISVKKISFLPVDDNNTELMLFMSGQLDWIYQIPPARLKYWTEKDEFNNSSKYGTYLFRINQEIPSLSHPKAKLALNLSINRDLIVESVTQGGEMPALGLVPDGVEGYTPHRPFIYSPDSAKKLWEEAQLDSGEIKEFDLLYNQSESNKKIAEAIAQMWEKTLNVKVNISNVEWKTLLSKMTKLEYDVIRGAWIGDFQDPITFLELFESSNGNNRTGYKDAIYDSLVEASVYETNPEARFKILNQLEKRLLDNPPIIPIYFYRNRELRHTRIKGITENAFGIYNYHELTLEKH